MLEYVIKHIKALKGLLVKAGFFCVIKHVVFCFFFTLSLSRTEKDRALLRSNPRDRYTNKQKVLKRRSV
jgi:hypothetical protein